MQKRIDELKVGDRVDLYGDPFADPARDPMRGHEFELERVSEIKIESRACFAIGFEQGPVVGFPPWHTVEVEP